MPEQEENTPEGTTLGGILHENLHVPPGRIVSYSGPTIVYHPTTTTTFYTYSANTNFIPVQGGLNTVAFNTVAFNTRTRAIWDPQLVTAYAPQEIREVRDPPLARRWARATDRARELLLSFLTDEQRATYESDRYFDVVGSLGTIFRIGRGAAGNIWVLDAQGNRFARICAHPSSGLPEPDVHLAQMFALMSDEEQFVRIANLHAGHRVRYNETDGIRRALLDRTLLEIA